MPSADPWPEQGLTSTVHQQTDCRVWFINVLHPSLFCVSRSLSSALCAAQEAKFNHLVKCQWVWNPEPAWYILINFALRLKSWHRGKTRVCLHTVLMTRPLTGQCALWEQRRKRVLLSPKSGTFPSGTQAYYMDKNYGRKYMFSWTSGLTLSKIVLNNSGHSRKLSTLFIHLWRALERTGPSISSK